MLNVVIGKKTVNIPEGWHELTIKRYVEIFKFREDNYQKGKEERYIKEFCEFITGIELDEVPLTDVEEGLAIFDLYNVISWMESFPKKEDIKELISFKFKGVEYMANVEESTVLGNKSYMRNESYGAFAHASIVRELFNELKEGDIKRMALLTAILFRPVKCSKWWQFWKQKGVEIEKYKEKEAEERSKEFETLTMDVVFGAYFFLKKRLSMYLKDTQTSLTELLLTKDVASMVGTK